MGEGWSGESIAAIVASALAVGGWLALLWLRGRRDLEVLGEQFEALARGRPVRRVMPRLGGLPPVIAERLNRVVPDLEDRIERLEADRSQLDAVLGGMSEGVLAVDDRQRIRFVNPAARRLFRIEPEDVGRLVAELVRNPQIQMAVEATLAGRGAYRAELTMPGRDPLSPDRARIVSVHGTPLPGHPPSGAVLVVHDVTDLRRLERMRQDFVANASHELKTPLAAIKVNTETLLDWALHDDAVNSNLLRQIDEQADRLDALVQDMLSLARLESGQEPFRMEPLAIRPLIEECVADQLVRARAHRLDFRAELGLMGESVRVRAAKEAIRQILNNLLDNAIKYTPEGGSIRLVGRADDARVTIEVADTGVGIPREDIPRIFERFYRVDKGRSRALGGTGLGLSIVKHLVQTLGGEVAVESRLGAGTTFTVRIPRCPEPRHLPGEGP